MPVHRRVGRRVVVLTVAAALVAAAPGASVAAPPCDPAGADAQAVTNARAAVQAACDCGAATGVDTWRRCVADALGSLVGSDLSDACRRHVWRIEIRSTCGRPDRVVCCRTNAAGRTTATRRRRGRCSAPPHGAACASGVAYVADACTASGCATACGDGMLEDGETCDPPNGTTCSNACSSCAPEAGSILLGCTATPTGVVGAATGDQLLFAYTDASATGGADALAKRLGNDGTITDAQPLHVSGLLPGTSASQGSTSGATSDGTGFYVAWITFADFFQYFGGRRVPASGPIVAAPEVLAANMPFGACNVSIAGPIDLAPTLDATSFHVTSRRLFSCMGQVLFETLGGVGDFFSIPPPGVVSLGAAPIVRGAHDVAAAWWGAYVDPPTPPIFFLAASLVEPGTPTLVALSHGSSPIAPALAAVGDTFVVLWASGSELRATRFTRAAGPLDPDGGFLVASGSGTIGALAAATDGSTVIAAWSESAGAAQSAIRAIHVAADGTIPDPPIWVASSSDGANVSVAANASATAVAFTRAEAGGSSVRVVLLGN